MISLQEQNWNNLITNLVHDWHGIWTRYSPQGDVIESFRSLRSFSYNSKDKEISHNNRYIYDNDVVEEKSWQFNQKDHNLVDGVCYPAISTMRGLFFDSGNAGWITKQLQKESFFSLELFFRSNNLRNSVGIVYNQQGDLLKTFNIKEDSKGFPSSYWSKDINQLTERNFKINTEGTSITMTPDLKISSPISTSFNWNWEGNKTFYLPDGVSISCPEKLILGTPFVFVANWLLKDNQLQQLIVKYDQLGVFSSLTLERFINKI